jgi:hypothetical protein
MNIIVTINNDPKEVLLDTITMNFEPDEVDNAFCLSIGESMTLECGDTITRVK